MRGLADARLRWRRASLHVLLCGVLLASGCLRFELDGRAYLALARVDVRLHHAARPDAHNALVQVPVGVTRGDLVWADLGHHLLLALRVRDDLHFLVVLQLHRRELAAHLLLLLRKQRLRRVLHHVLLLTIFTDLSSSIGLIVFVVGGLYLGGDGLAHKAAGLAARVAVRDAQILLLQ